MKIRAVAASQEARASRHRVWKTRWRAALAPWVGAVAVVSTLALAEPAPVAEPAPSLRMQQLAIRELGRKAGASADRELGRLLDEIDAGRLPIALWLDALQAAAQREDPALRARLAERARRLAGSPDPLRQWRECLEGGDQATGRTIFREKPEAGCIRCHRVNGEGGEIGPDLSTVAQRANRITILESIIDPNGSIVVGFKNVLLKMKDGREISGVVQTETADAMRVVSVIDGKSTTIRTSEIEMETGLPSAMPPGFGVVLGKRAIRDLVEFLATRD